jgi:hypothetical protein
MDDLIAVARLNARGVPAVARKNLEITLDCHAIERHPEMSQQSGYRQPFGNLTTIAVDRDGHGAAALGFGRKA